jgi:hypothetical protein
MAVHSLYAPISPLLEDLAALLVVDELRFEASDLRSDVEYLCEAFQRLILGFIIANRNSDFMKCKIDRNPRDPPEYGSANMSLTRSLWMAE